MTRGGTIAALSACAAAGAIAAVVLASAPGAGADSGTTTGGTTTGAGSTGAATTAPVTSTAPATTLPTQTGPKLIAAGVTVGRTLVGGLTVAEAREVVKTRFARSLTLLGGPGARIVVTPQEIGATPHFEKALQLAGRVRRPGYAVPLEVDVARPKLDRFVARLGARFQRDPVDSTLKLRNLVPFATRDVPGRRLKQVVTSRAIVRALKTQQREPMELKFDLIQPQVTANQVEHAIVIRRGSNKLLLYRIGAAAKLVRSFQVATGRSQYPTPLGSFEIINKWRDPWWYPPASDWAKDSKPIPPGPGNPLGTRWMGISSPNVGIHGTPDSASIGYSASHGCIRMLIPQVEWLFNQVDVGTPVFIVAA